MPRQYVLWGLLAWSLIASGCSLTRPSPAVQHYVLAVTLPEKATHTHTTSETLVVRPFTARDPYNQERLVYRSSPYQLDFYQYHRWASSPAQQITDWTRQYLRRAGLFAKVFPSPQGDANLTLSGAIRQIEEVDHNQTWEAILSIDVWLTRPRQRSPFWFQSYTVSRQAARRNPTAIAEALSHNLAAILHQLATDLVPVVNGSVP